MTVTIIFKNDTKNTHTGQDFTSVVSWEFHNTYNFLELVFVDGTSKQFNLADIFTVELPAVPAK